MTFPDTSVREKDFDPEVLSKSVQEPPPSTVPFYQDAAIFFIAQQADEMEPWGRSAKLRDRQLREFIPVEPLFASALGIVAARNAAFSWILEGPERKSAKMQRILQQANFGKGWTDFITKISVDLYTQDSGAFFEIIREGQSLESPVIGVAHLDAARCFSTGVPEEPVWYQDRNGKYHRMKWWQVVHLTEMPATWEGMPGLQYCALTRMLRSVRIMRDISVYLSEKIGGRNMRAVTMLKGVTSQAVNEAWNIARLQHDAAGLLRYTMPVLVSSVDPKADIGFETLEIASLPDGFDLDLTTKQYVAQIAMAFMTDYQEFAPLPGGNLGTSAQSEILHAKSRGKGPGLFMKLMTEALNFNVLPEDVEFKFDEQDQDADKLVADTRLVHAQERQIRMATGEITVDIAREIAVEMDELSPEQLEALKEQEAIDEEMQLLEEATQTPEQQVPGVESEAGAIVTEEGAPQAQFDQGGAVIGETAKEVGDEGSHAFRGGTTAVKGVPDNVDFLRLDVEEQVTQVVASAFARARARLEERGIVVKHLPGQHNQMSHGHHGGGGGGGSRASMAKVDAYIDQELSRFGMEPEQHMREFGLNTIIAGRTESDILKSDQYLLDRGHSPEVVKELSVALNMHGHGGDNQIAGDARLVDAWHSPGSPLGAAMRDRAELETRLMERWVKAQDRDSLYEHKNNLKQDTNLYRGGGDKDLESWTTNKGGAVTDPHNNVRIPVTKRMPMTEVRERGFMVLGGVTTMVGAPGEGEILLIRNTRLKEVELKHLPGAHNQLSHGQHGGGGGGGASGVNAIKRMAKGESVVISPSDLDNVLSAAATMEAVNLQQLHVTGEGNEHLFAAHLRELPRSEMPQLPRDAAGMLRFKEHLDARGLKYSLEHVDPRTLQSTQNYLDSQKVGQVYKRFVETGGFRTGDTLLASREGGVLDGHHRFAAVSAYAATHAGTRVNVLRIDAPIDTVLKVAHEFE